MGAEAPYSSPMTLSACSHGGKSHCCWMETRNYFLCQIRVIVAGLRVIIIVTDIGALFHMHTHIHIIEEVIEYLQGYQPIIMLDNLHFGAVSWQLHSSWGIWPTLKLQANPQSHSVETCWVLFFNGKKKQCYRQEVIVQGNLEI